MNRNVVFRVENKDGEGPYRSKILKDFVSEVENYFGESIKERLFYSSSSHPLPRDDYLLRKNHYDIFDFLCCFSSVNQMTDWFFSDWFYLFFEEKGFKIKMLEGEVITGDKQSLIKKYSFKVLHEFSPLEFFDKFVRVLSFDEEFHKNS